MRCRGLADVLKGRLFRRLLDARMRALTACRLRVMARASARAAPRRRSALDCKTSAIEAISFFTHIQVYHTRLLRRRAFNTASALLLNDSFLSTPTPLCRYHYARSQACISCRHEMTARSCICVALKAMKTYARAPSARTNSHAMYYRVSGIMREMIYCWLATYSAICWEDRVCIERQPHGRHGAMPTSKRRRAVSSIAAAVLYRAPRPHVPSLAGTISRGASPSRRRRLSRAA